MISAGPGASRTRPRVGVRLERDRDGDEGSGHHDLSTHPVNDEWLAVVPAQDVLKVGDALVVATSDVPEKSTLRSHDADRSALLRNDGTQPLWGHVVRDEPRDHGTICDVCAHDSIHRSPLSG